MNYQSEAEERKANWDRFKISKRFVYRLRLERVIDGVAWCSGRTIPNDDDVMEAQRIMDREYLSLFAF